MKSSRASVCTKFILIYFLCVQIGLGHSFDLFSKNIYWIGGANTSNIDASYPFNVGRANNIGSRMGAASWVDSIGNLWVFGGYAGGVHLSDMWRYKAGVWYWEGGSRGANDGGQYGVIGGMGTPANRNMAASWVGADGRLWLFGGNSFINDTVGTSPLNDLWAYNVTTKRFTWMGGDRPQIPVQTRTDMPSARSGAAAWGDGVDLSLFGGSTAGGATNDVWQYNIVTNIWTLVEAPRPGSYMGAPPAVGYPNPRSDAAVWLDSAKAVWIFGGQNSGAYLSDMWRYSTRTGVWAWVSGSAMPDDVGSFPANIGATGVPPARANACSWLEKDGSLWMYGGHTVGSTGTRYAGDFWKRSMNATSTSWLWAGTSSTASYPRALNTTGGPGPRSYATCWQDSVGNMLFYGGQNTEGTWDDIWDLDMNECATNNGGCGTTCNNPIIDPYTCDPCPFGFAGNPYVENCTDVDECAFNNGGCDLLTNCTNNIGAPPNCSACPQGYNGTGETGCVDFDECTVNNGGCDPHSNCTAGFLDEPPTCGPCPAGYNGTGYTGCIDINECLVDNGGCDKLTNCTNNEAADHTCGPCPSGYNGTGYTGCIDIDECAIDKGGCDPQTSCTNNVGAPPTCGSCPSGYVGTGYTGCTDYDECSENNGGCPDQSVCTNHIGKPATCGPCINGFIGNNFCGRKKKHSSRSAGLIAGVTVGGFVVLLLVIGLIFYFTKDQAIKKLRKRNAPPTSSTSSFQLTTLSQAQ